MNALVKDTKVFRVPEIGSDHLSLYQKPDYNVSDISDNTTKWRKFNQNIVIMRKSLKCIFYKMTP